MLLHTNLSAYTWKNPDATPYKSQHSQLAESSRFSIQNLSADNYSRIQKLLHGYVFRRSQLADSKWFVIHIQRLDLAWTTSYFCKDLHKTSICRFFFWPLSSLTKRIVQNQNSQSKYLRIRPHTVNTSESAITKWIFQNQPSQREYFRISPHKENISESAITKRIFQNQP